MTDASERYILVVSHTGRADSIDAAVQVVEQLRAADITPVLFAAERDDILERVPDLGYVAILDQDIVPSELELVIVLGGDGTILRAAEIVRGYSAPLLGVNLGHVGFLA